MDLGEEGWVGDRGRKGFGRKGFHGLGIRISGFGRRGIGFVGVEGEGVTRKRKGWGGGFMVLR